MQKEYKMFLINAGFSVKTIQGKSSTVYDYLRGLKRVCQEENLNIEGLAKNIDRLVIKYQPMGEHSNIGKQVSRSVRCSLVQFSKFINERKAA
jgi:hypothetical protein